MTRYFELGFFTMLLIMILSLLWRAGMQWSQAALITNW